MRGGEKMSQKVMVRFVAAVMFALGALASAVAQMPNPYGPAISLENAKKAAAPALAEAAKNNWRVAVAGVGSAGAPLFYQKKEKTPTWKAGGGHGKGPTAPPLTRAPQTPTGGAA